jgi:hypothetical protein
MRKFPNRHDMPLKPSLRSRRELVLLAASFALVAGCATPPPPPPPVVVAPAPEPEPPPPPPPAPPPAPEALQAADVPRVIAATVELLEAGDSAQAEVELRKVLATDPNNRLALSLMRQIRDEPLSQFGKESFSYRVQPGESLSSIARRFMGDVYLFYGLARYNGIKVPRNLSGGQMIRVPGKAPAASALPPPERPPVAAPATPPAPAPTPAPAPAPGQTEEQKRAAEIAKLTRAARAAFARQDLTGAIRNWDAVLKLDAENAMAKTERQKVQALKDTYDSLDKSKPQAGSAKPKP